MINKLLQVLFKHIDSFLMGCLLFTMLVGLFVLYSASGRSIDRVSAQMINIVVALLVMWLVANIQPQLLERIAVPAYLLGVLLLIAVALFGDISHGARRWLNLGVTKIQPSEIMRIAMPMMLAWFFAKRESHPRITDFLIAAALLIVPVALIMKQPDLEPTVSTVGIESSSRPAQSNIHSSYSSLCLFKNAFNSSLKDCLR